MKLPEPVERISQQEIPHLVAAVVENVSAPIGMLALARLEMFVKRGAVEAPKGKCVFRKMSWDPVHDHADAALVQIIDQKTKVVGRSITRGGRKVVADLITPRWAIGMLFQRQELNVRKTHRENVLGQRPSHFA